MKPINIINTILKKLHDYYFVTIDDNLDKNSSKLTFLSEDKKNKIVIDLINVKNSRCMDWKYGNIILDAEIVNPSSNRIIDLINFLEDYTEIEIKKQKYLSVLEQIKRNKLYILEINPSYGAYYLALIEDIRIIEN